MAHSSKEYMRNYMREYRKRQKNPEQLFILREMLDQHQHFYDRPIQQEQPKPSIPEASKECETFNLEDLIKKGLNMFLDDLDTRLKILHPKFDNSGELAEFYKEQAEEYRDVILALIDFEGKSWIQKQYQIINNLAKVSKLIVDAIDYRKNNFPEHYEPERERWETYRKHMETSFVKFSETAEWLKSRHTIKDVGVV